MWVPFCNVLKEKFDWVTIKLVLRKSKSGIYHLIKAFSYTQLQDSKKLTLRIQFHQKSLAYLVHQKTNIESINEEIDATASPEVSLPKDIDEIGEAVGPCNFDEFVSSIQMTPEQQKLLIDKTKDQRMSNIWFEHCKDRITASILKSAALKVDSNNKLINQDNSRTILSKICGYYPRCKSKATDWGISNESGARNAYAKTMKKKNQNFKVEETSYIGASPDGLVECDCHGSGLLEIKCPWSHQNLTVSEYSAMNGSCLYLDGNVIYLIKTDEYFYQVQCQMFVTNRNYCDFFVCTAKDSFCE